MNNVYKIEKNKDKIIRINLKNKKDENLYLKLTNEIC